MVPGVTMEPLPWSGGGQAGAAFPYQAAEDGYQEAAQQDVIRDGQGGHHILGDDCDQDGHGAERQHPEPVGLYVVLGVVRIVRVDALAQNWR